MAHFGVKAAQIPISGSLLFLQTLIWGFFAPVWLLEAPLAGAGPAGLQKTPTRPPPHTPCQHNGFLGGKAAESVKPPEGRGFPPVLGGFGVGRCPHATSGGVPALPPPPDALNRPESSQIRRPSPHPPRGSRGGSGWGEGRTRYLPPPIWGGFASNLRLPRPLLAPTLTRFGDKSLNLTIPAAGFGEKTWKHDYCPLPPRLLQPLPPRGFWGGFTFLFS